MMSSVTRAGRLHLADIGEPPRRLAMSPEGRGSPSKAVTMPIVSTEPSLPARLGLDTHQLELFGPQAERLPATSLSRLRAWPASSGDDREAVDVARGDDEEAHRVDRARAFREEAPAAARPSGRHSVDERPRDREVAELGAVYCRLRRRSAAAGRPARSHADLAGRNLHPGILLDR